MQGRGQQIKTGNDGTFSISQLPAGDYASCVTVPGTDYVDDCLWNLNFLPRIQAAVSAAPGLAAKAPQLITDVPLGSSKLVISPTSANANQVFRVRKGARLILQFLDPGKVIDKNTHLIVGALGPGGLMIPADQANGGTLSYELLIPFDTAVNVMISSLDVQISGPSGSLQSNQMLPFKIAKGSTTPVTAAFTVNGRKGK